MQDNPTQTSKIGLSGPERSAQKPFHRKKRASETPSEQCGPWPYFPKLVRVTFVISKDLVRFAHEV